MADLWWLVAGRRSKAGVSRSEWRIRLEELRLTSLLGRSSSFKDGREGWGDSSSREEDDAGLLFLPRERLDIRLNHDEPGVDSLRSVDESRSDVQGLNMECLLTELSRDSALVLSVAWAEGVFE